MLSRAVCLAVLIVLATSGSAGAVQFGGGYVPSPETRVFDPAAVVTLDVVGGATDYVRYRFSTAIRCGDRDVFEVDKYSGGVRQQNSIRVSGDAQLPYGGRVLVEWVIEMTVAGDTATGILRMKGTSTRNGRTEQCSTPDRPLKLHAVGNARGVDARPAPNAAFYGVGTRQKPHRSALVLAVNASTTRALAFWSYAAPCSRGPDERRANYSPLRRIVRGRYLSRERFTVRFLDGVVGHYRATLDVRFHGASATGTYRMRVRFTHRGRTTVRCDSKMRSFNAWAM